MARVEVVAEDWPLAGHEPVGIPHDPGAADSVQADQLEDLGEGAGCKRETSLHERVALILGDPERPLDGVLVEEEAELTAAPLEVPLEPAQRT